MADIDVTDNQQQQRYETHTDEGVGFAAYRLREDTDPTTVVFTHTEVPQAVQGTGVAGELVRAALDDVRRRGRQVRPDCPYIAHWIDEHPEYADLRAA